MKPATVDELLAEVLTWTLQGQFFTQPGSKRERHGTRVKGQKVFGLSTIKHALAQGLVDVATVSVSPWGNSDFEGGSFTQVKLTAEGRRRVRDQMASAAEKLGLVRSGAVRTARRSSDREPLYLQARTVWADRIDKPTGGGVAREAGTYEQDLSEAIKDVPVRLLEEGKE